MGDGQVTLIPCKGDRFRAIEPVEVWIWVQWFDAPASDGNDAVLPVGEEVLVDEDPNGPEGCWVVPVRFRELEPVLVAERIRLDPDYPATRVGRDKPWYGVAVSYADLARRFVRA